MMAFRERVENAYMDLARGSDARFRLLLNTNVMFQIYGGLPIPGKSDALDLVTDMITGRKMTTLHIRPMTRTQRNLVAAHIDGCVVTMAFADLQYPVVHDLWAGPKNSVIWLRTTFGALTPGH